MKKKTLIILSVIFLCFLFIVAFITKSMIEVTNKDKISKYDTYELKPERAIKVTGKVSPVSIKTYQNNLQVGEFVSVQVDEGQHVRQGQPLINYQIDQSNRNRIYEQLRNAESKGNQVDINQYWKQLNQYDNQIKNSVYASFDGIVSNIKRTNVGNGERILKLISTESQIKTTISEFDLKKISVGDTTNVTVTSTGQKGKGKIQSISELPTSYEENQYDSQTTINGEDDTNGKDEKFQTMNNSNPTEFNPTDKNDNTSSKYTVIIGDLDFNVRNGFSIEAEIPLDTIKLPSSIFTKDKHVYVIDKNSKVHKRQIEYVENNGDIILKKGLKKGDKLVKNPDNNLKDGQKIEVSP